jgi:hypothetical protein
MGEKHHNFVRSKATMPTGAGVMAANFRARLCQRQCWRAILMETWLSDESLLNCNSARMIVRGMMSEYPVRSNSQRFTLNYSISGLDFEFSIPSRLLLRFEQSQYFSITIPQ